MFDIFKGTITEGGAMWLEAVTSLEHARQRMEESVVKSRGQYFVFSQEAQSVVARTDTRKSVSPSPRKGIRGQPDACQWVQPRRRTQG